MKRAIKFRVWDNKRKQMYPLVSIWKHINQTTDHVVVRLRGYRVNTLFSNYNIMQFTGLKDKNGKEIYEGDIINHEAFYGYVLFEDGMFAINTNANVNFPNHKQPMCYHNTNLMEVVGNIYENHELIKQI